MTSEAYTPKMRNRRYIKTAYQWHGGQSCPLYSFASTGGTIHGSDHAHECACEIRHILKDEKRKRERATLQNFLRWLDKAEHRLCPDDDL